MKSEKSTVAKAWLEGLVSGITLKNAKFENLTHGGVFSAVSLSGLRITTVSGGYALCSFTVPAHLTDLEGNWKAGAIATAMDDVAAAAIMSEEGQVKATVDFNITYLSSAKTNDEVEIEAKVVRRKGRLTAVTVEVRKKGNGKVVAIGRQWTSGSRPLHIISNL